MKTADEILAEALPRFVTYLNLWWNHDPPIDYKTGETELSPYTVECFTVDDSSRGLYGSSGVEGDFGPHMDSVHRIVAATVYDGDDGGPSELIIVVDDEDEIDCIIHYFDTMPALIVERNAYRTPPDGEMKTIP